MTAGLAALEKTAPSKTGRLLIPTALSPDDLKPPPQGSARFRLDGETMGTYWAVTLYARPSEVRISSLRHDIETVFSRIIAQMSLWEASSDICRFNKAAPGSQIVLAEDFAQVLEKALAIAATTEGHYDPTLGMVSDRWGFGASAFSGAPESRETAALRRDSGYNMLQFDPATRVLRQPGGLWLDLCSIAKGYTVDLVSGLLTAQGIACHLVDIGGELKGQGIKPDGRPWQVGLDCGTALPAYAAALVGHAVATSGHGARFQLIDGIRHSHVLDGLSGAPAATDLTSVSVMAPNCMDADGWATALLAMGLEKGKGIAEQKGLAALFCRETEDPHLSPAMAACLEDD